MSALKSLSAVALRAVQRHASPAENRLAEEPPAVVHENAARKTPAEIAQPPSSIIVAMRVCEARPCAVVSVLRRDRRGGFGRPASGTRGSARGR